MQTGSVLRHGRGWGGYWREGGKRRAAETCTKKGEAREKLNAELDRIRLGASYRAPITLRELSHRFLEQYVAAPRTVNAARQRLKRPLAAFGDVQAGDLTTETLQAFLARQPVGKATRRDIVRTLRAVYSFGADAGLIADNPAKRVRAPAAGPRREDPAAHVGGG